MLILVCHGFEMLLNLWKGKTERLILLQMNRFGESNQG